ncbi:MAG TPA: hypothetical protein VMW43_08020 [Bacteroidota bacterium]|nr:hypothetical protein [Bacteroidota bacterium]
MKATITFLAALWFVLAGFQTVRHSNFSGTWKLDLKKCKNLPPSFRSIEKYTFVVTQSDDSIVGVATMVGSGQEVTLPPMIYLLSGKEEYSEDTLRFVKRWSRSEWATTGTKLIIHKRSIQGQKGKEQTTTQTDVWELKDRSTLLMTLTQKFEKGDSTHSEQRVFRRVR